MPVVATWAEGRSVLNGWFGFLGRGTTCREEGLTDIKLWGIHQGNPARW